MVEMLVANGADVQAVDMDGNTAYHSACHNHKFNCLRLLGEHFNQLNADGDAVLHILCKLKISKENLPECLKLLREPKNVISICSIKKERHLFILHADGAMVM